MIRRVLILAGAVACSGAPRPPGQIEVKGGPVATTRTINQVLAAHADSLMALPGVVGTAIGLCDGEKCIQVMVVDSAAAKSDKIPDRLEGYRVVTEVTGTMRPRRS